MNLFRLAQGLVMNLDWVTTLTSHQSGILDSLTFCNSLMSGPHSFINHFCAKVAMRQLSVHLLARLNPDIWPFDHEPEVVRSSYHISISKLRKLISYKKENCDTNKCFNRAFCEKLKSVFHLL